MMVVREEHGPGTMYLEPSEDPDGVKLVRVHIDWGDGNMPIFQTRKADFLRAIDEFKKDNPE